MAETAPASNLKKDGTPKAKRGEGGKPRPAYLVYAPKVDDNGAFTGEIDVVTATRNAEGLLSEIDKDRSLKYVRFEIK